MKFLTGHKKNYVIDKKKLEVLRILHQQIQTSNEVKEGMSFFEGFEVFSTKTFRFNFEAVSIYRVVLKVKEEEDKVLLKSTINTNWYFELTLFLTFIISLFFVILMTYNYSFYPVFDLKAPKDFYLQYFSFLWFFLTLFSLKKVDNFRREGQKAIDTILEPLKED